MNRQEVYQLIDGERNYQDSKWGGRPHDDMKSVGDFITYMQVYLRKAQERLTLVVGQEEALNEIRKVTALGVACMETHETPKR